MKLFRYFLSRLKSHIKASPTVIAVALVSAAALALLANTVIQNAANSEDAGKLFKIGVTGDLEQRYIDLAVTTMNDLDTSRLSVEFVTLDEKDAPDMLLSGEIIGYVVVPSGFVEAAARAQFIPVKYVSEGLDTALGDAVVREFVMVAEQLADVVQQNAFGMERYLLSKGVGREDTDSLTDDIALRHADYLLKRDSILKVDLIGDDSEITVGVYYFSSFTLFFVMLFGIGCAAHLVKRDMSLPKLLYSRKIGAVRQVGSEVAAYFIFTYVFMFMILALGGWVMSQEALSSAFGGKTFSSFVLFALKLAPAIAMIASAQIFLYECVEGVVGGVLLQFVAAIFTAYISGYFYPSSFFPQTLQKIARALPGGVVFSYAKSALTSGELEHLPAVALYTVLFIVLTVAARKIRLGRDAV